MRSSLPRMPCTHTRTHTHAHAHSHIHIHTLIHLLLSTCSTAPLCTALYRIHPALPPNPPHRPLGATPPSPLHLLAPDLAAQASAGPELGPGQDTREPDERWCVSCLSLDGEDVVGCCRSTQYLLLAQVLLLEPLVGQQGEEGGGGRL